MFSFIKDRKFRKKRAAELYDIAVAQSRQPEFYAQLNVPDTVDGRFEMIAMHCGILVYCLKKEEHAKLSQALFDKMFKVMDPMLREMGVGDLSVPKHMKRMMQGFNGRAIKYAQAIEKKDKKELEKSILRNIYGTLEEKNVRREDLELMADYILASIASMPDLTAGTPDFALIVKESSNNAAA